MNTVETVDRVIAIDVDIQNDFCKGGSLAVLDGDAVVPPMNQVNRWVRDHHGQVIFTRDWHPAKTPHFDTWPPHCIQNTPGAAFHQDLDITAADTIASKGMGQDDGYSGYFAKLQPDSPLYKPVRKAYLSGKEFVGNAINSLQKERTAVLIGGLATDFCVQATVLDTLCHAERSEQFGAALGVYVLRDAIRAVNLQPGDGDKAIAEMEAAGATFIDSQDLLEGRVLGVRR